MKRLVIAAVIIALSSVCWGDSIPPYLLLNTSGTITQYDPAHPSLTVFGTGASGGLWMLTATGENWARGQGYITGTLEVYAPTFTLLGRLNRIGFPDGPGTMEAFFTGTYIDPSGVQHRVKNYFLVESMDFQTMRVGQGGMRLGLQTPEPESLYLFASGLAMVGGAVWRKMKGVTA